MILAQIDATKATEGMGRDFLPWAVLGLCLALGFVVRSYLVMRAEKDKAIAELQKAKDEAIKALQKEKDDATAALQSQLLAQIRSDGAELRKTLESVLPAQARMLEIIDLVKEGVTHE